MKTLPLHVVIPLLLASVAGAQANYSFQIDSNNTSFTWSGTTSVGDIDEQPSTFTLVGDTRLTLDTGGSPVGSGQFSNGGDAVVTPDLYGEIPNPFPFLPPLAQIWVTNAHVKFSSPSFTLDATGAFSTSVTLTFLSGTVTIDDIGGGHTVLDLTGETSNPEQASGWVHFTGSGYMLDIPVSAVFDFADPTSGITGTITLSGGLIANYDPPAPTSYCTGMPNSVGAGASISASGSTSIGMADLVILTTGMPTYQFGLHFYGPNQANAVFGNGIRCVGAPLVRLHAASTGALGQISNLIDNSLLPSGGEVMVGDTRNFQCWYRDPAGGGALMGEDVVEVVDLAVSCLELAHCQLLVPLAGHQGAGHLAPARPDAIEELVAGPAAEPVVEQDEVRAVVIERDDRDLVRLAPGDLRRESPPDRTSTPERAPGECRFFESSRAGTSGTARPDSEPRSSYFSAGVVNGRSSQRPALVAKGPTWYLQTTVYFSFTSGPSHVAEQVKPQPYRNAPLATCLPSSS